MEFKINTVPEDVRDKILAKVKELSDLLNDNGVNILLNQETYTTRLLPQGFRVEVDGCQGDDADTDDADTYVSDEFEFIDLPVEIYDPNFHTIVKD